MRRYVKIIHPTCVLSPRVTDKLQPKYCATAFFTRLSIVATIVTYLFIPLFSFAQQVRFDRIGIADGLSSNTVYAIQQDSHGKLWIGTLDGLDQYDGYQITTLHHNHSTAGTLPDNRITAIHEDHAHRLWLYDEFKSIIVRYDRIKNSFKAYYLDKMAPRAPEVCRVFAGAENSVQVHSMHGYLFTYHEEEDAFVLESTSFPFVNDDRVPANAKLISAFDEYLQASRSNFNSSTLGIRKIIRDHQGRYWIATRYDGLYSATFRQNSYWFVSHLRNTDKFQLVNSEEINDVFEDQSQVIWIATRNRGLYRYSPHKYKFDAIKSVQNDQGTLELSVVRAIVQDRNKNIWVGTNDQGLIRIDSTLKYGKQYLPGPREKNSLARRHIRSLWIDPNQELWIGQYAAISQYRPSGDNFKTYYPDPGHGEEVRVYDFKSDKSNGLWIAGWDAILHFNTLTETFRYLSKETAGQDFEIDNIRDLELLPDGRPWIAAGEKGLSIATGADGKLRTLHYPQDSRNGLPSNNIFDIYADSRKHVWLATADGLCQFDPKQLTCKIIGGENGLPSSLMYGILEDDAGNLWISSTRGLIKYAPASGAVKVYDVEDGLQSNEFTENAFCISSNGVMFFGGIDGINYFDPDHISENRKPPAVAITTVRVFDKPLLEVTLFSELEVRQRMETPGHILLAPEQRSVSFEFVGLHYVNPKKNRYAYMLHGFDSSWIYRDASMRTANYTNLEPGRYTFRVKAANSDGYWSEPVGVTIIIDIPFYATLWFQITMACLLIFVSVIGYRMRIAALKVQQALKAEQLETELNFLKSQVNPHFLFNSLNNIYSLCQVNSRNAAPMVGKISEMMRYMLYDCKDNYVSLQKEIDYLKNYMDLQQLKSNRKLNVILAITGNTHGRMIAPLLFINFLENSYKHGNLTFNHEGFIRCEINVGNTTLTFTLVNSYQHKKIESKRDHGIGLENARHRLELLYRDKHTLVTHGHNGHYEVRLVIHDA